MKAAVAPQPAPIVRAKAAVAPKPAPIVRAKAAVGGHADGWDEF